MDVTAKWLFLAGNLVVNAGVVRIEQIIEPRQQCTRQCPDVQHQGQRRITDQQFSCQELGLPTVINVQSTQQAIASQVIRMAEQDDISLAFIGGCRQ